MKVRGMRKRWCVAAPGVLAALALAAPGLAAQQQGPPHGQHHGALLVRVPAAILHQAGALGLSDDQVARVEALRDSIVAIHGRRMRAMQGRGGDFEEAFTDDGIDLDAYRSALRAAADRMVETRVAVAEVAQSALQVLDASQREKFLYALHVMHRGTGMGGRSRGMMHGEDTMHGEGGS